METYARELIPPLAALGVRLTALVNREAAAAEGPWHDVVPMELVPVRARNRVEWVRGEQQHVPRIAAAHRRRRRSLARVDGARVGPRRAGDHRARPPVPRRAGRPRRPARTRDAGARAGRRPALGARPRRLARHEGRHHRPPRRPARQDRRDPARRFGPPARHAGTRARAARAARPRRAPRAARGIGQAPAEEPHGPARRARRHPTRAAAAARHAGVRDTARGRAQGARCRAAAHRGQRCSSAGCRPRTSRACTHSLSRSCSRRSTRGSGSRSSRRWPAACRSPARTAPLSPRWPATRRCLFDPTDPRAIAGAVERLISDDRLAARPAGPRPRARQTLHLGTHGTRDARRLQPRCRAGVVARGAARVGTACRRGPYALTDGSTRGPPSPRRGVSASDLRGDGPVERGSNRQACRAAPRRAHDRSRMWRWRTDDASRARCRRRRHRGRRVHTSRRRDRTRSRRACRRGRSCRPAAVRNR